MENKVLTAVLIGAGQRGMGYSRHALSHPERLQIVGVAEPDVVRRSEFAKKYSINESDCLVSWEDVFTREKWADVAIICTQDKMHYGPVMAAIDRGYDILLEKPISPVAQECLDIVRAAEDAGVKLVVCHVLRYTPFFTKIKEIIDSGQIGTPVSIVHNENVGDIHHSHSFVRGNWAIIEESSPMILAKSCHDLDLLQWLLGTDCLRLSSFGSLSFFTRDNCPPAAPPRCTDGCNADCPYDARKLYLHSDNEWFRSVAAGRVNPADDEVLAALQNGPYGRCVYQCDNNAVDHQVVSMEFEQGVTAVFNMSSLTPHTTRTIKIMGTKGEIKGHAENNSIVVTNFSDRSEMEYVTTSEGGHGGGDSGIMNASYQYMSGGSPEIDISEAAVSAKNHMLCFAAEKSRLSNGSVVEMQEFMAELES